MQKNIIPEGTRDFIGDECSARDKLINKVEDVFAKLGYEEVITPTVEYYNTFHYKTQSLKEEEMYKFFDSKGKILVLRPDMTVPIARVVATKLKDHKIPIRLRYKAKVYRVNESLGGKRNEYTDCGVELIGLDSNSSDLEILITALQVLKVVDVEGYKLEVGDINFFNSAINTLNLRDEEKIKLAELIEKKSLKSLEDFLNQLNIEEDKKEFFKKLPWLFGGRTVLNDCKKIVFNNEMVESLKYLESLYNKLEELGFGDFVTLDLGMVPRLNYYTGIIFRGYVQGVGNTVLSGGRYDNLIKVFGRDEKAIGFSINIDCLIELVKGKSYEVKNEVIIKFNKENEDIKYFLVKATDSITYVEHGATDIGVVGKDTLLESNYSSYEVMDLGFGKCKFIVASLPDRDLFNSIGHIKIGSKYPTVTKEFFKKKGMDVEVIKIEGSVELAPILGLCDGIVDIMETGTTLKENGLVVLEDICEISARVIVNKASFKLKQKEINSFLNRVNEQI